MGDDFGDLYCQRILQSCWGDSLPTPLGNRKLHYRERERLEDRFQELWGSGNVRGKEYEDCYRRYLGWYIDLQKIGRVFARMDSQETRNVRSRSG